jgi:hypothetical protein
MLSITERNKKVKWTTHLMQSFKERKRYFPYDSSLKEMMLECIAALRDPKIGIILKDNREGVNSSHLLMFVTQSGEIVVVPIYVNDESIMFFTIKSVREDESNPNWFIREYNKIATIRGMKNLPEIVKLK